MSSTVETSIGNRALTKLGVARVTAFEDDSKAGRALTANYDRLRDWLLRAHLWNFAMVRTTLEVSTTEPSWGFSYLYALPDECLRLVQVDEFVVAGQGPDYRAGSDAPYQLEGRSILTDIGSPLKVRYVKRETNAGRFDEAFCEALACKIAMELAEELTQSATKREAAKGDFREAIREARRLDAIENPPEGIADDSWVLGRL